MDVSGHKYGSHFFNADLLLSDSKGPAGASGFSFEGCANFIASKGKNEFGAEYHFRAC